MNFDIDFFEVKNDKLAKAGRILISEPFLSDTYFKRSVVLLTEHTEEGSVGFVLNKPVDIGVKDILQDFPAVKSGISIGGPVNTNTVHYIHTLGKIIPESIQVTDTIFWGGDFNIVKELIEAGEVKDDQIRFFLGYSGWSAKQLDNEIQDNAWLIAEIGSDAIMKGLKADFWNEVLEKMRNKYKVWANFPENPGLN